MTLSATLRLPGFAARIRARWGERVAERRAFQERWQAALEEYPEMRELQSHLREFMDEVAGLRHAFEEVDETAPDYQQLEKHRQTLAEEYRPFDTYSRDLVAQHPATRLHGRSHNSLTSRLPLFPPIFYR